MMERGRLVSALALKRKARVLVVAAHGPARELCQRHGLRGSAARQAAGGLVTAALLSSHIKGEERLTVHVKSVFPPFVFSCDLDGDGAVRGALRPAELPELSRFSGVLSVLKSLGRQELYRGHAEINNESFEAALHRYFLTSEQVDGRVRILVELDEAGEVLAAAGILVERFPDLSPEEFAAAIDGPLEADLRGVLDGFAFGQLGDDPVEVFEARDLFFRCTCSRERVRATLLALGAAELREMLREPGYGEVTCHFCNEVYRFEPAELQEMAGIPES